MDVEQIITILLECSKNIRRQLGPGYLERVYKNAMIVELRKHQLSFEIERPIVVYYDDIIVGDFKADIIVEGKVILELKAVSSISVGHEIQLVNYLTATGIEDGLLINFGSETLQYKRKFRTYRRRNV
ncbi:MAG: GxxExxY protein [Prevotella sp.]|nr:GxxExxY protein [Prevotella sp.]